MLEFSWFVCGIFSYILYWYLFSKLTDKKFVISKKMILCDIIAAILYLILMKFNIEVLRPLIIYIMLFLTTLIIYSEKISKIIIVILCIVIITFLSEMIYGFVTVTILKIDMYSALSHPIEYILTNIIVSFICIILVNIRFINRIFKNIIAWYCKNSFKILLLLIVLLIFTAMFILYNNFVNILPNSILWLTNIFSFSVIIFVIGYFKEKSNNNRITIEYDQLLKYVQKYEKIIDEKSKNQHEYKNQLIMIKSMINNKDNNVVKYIDGLYKNEKDDVNIEIIKKLQNLPQGGLKGLIYYKIDEMLNKKINVFVQVSSKLKFNKEIKNNLQDISKIIGVYLDNAIEAASNSKEKYIIIDIYLDNGNIIFSFSNTYSDVIYINNVDTEGYTTKGNGKGYGLSLVKDIIGKNELLDQEKSFNGIYYVQKLIIKK